MSSDTSFKDRNKIGKSDIAIIIQGPLNLTSINNIPSYKKFADEIIVSCWEGDDLSSLDHLRKDNSVKIVCERCPPVGRGSKFGTRAHRDLRPDIVAYHGELTAEDRNNFARLNALFKFYNTLDAALTGCLNGINATTKKFIIRAISRERYSNLAPLIDRHSSLNSVMTFSSIPFRSRKKDHVHQYHIGSNLIMIDRLIYKKAVESYRESRYSLCIHPCQGMTEESHFAMWVMRAIGINPISENIPHELFDKAFVKYFDVIPIELLGDFFVKSSGSSWSSNDPRPRNFTKKHGHFIDRMEDW